MMQPEHHTREALPIGTQGWLKVAHWVIATVPTEETARACGQVLEEAGFADDDVLVESSATALRQLQAEEDGKRHAGALHRLISTVEDAVTEEPVREMRDRYVAAARAGRVFIGARDVQGNQVDFIRNLFVERGASDVYLFEPPAITRLG